MSDEAALRAPAIGVVQAAAVIDDVDRNLDTLDALVGQAARESATTVVTPELFATGYAPDRAWRHDGAAVRAALAVIAARHRVMLAASSVDATDDGHAIAASLFGPDGAELMRAHKRHLYGATEQRWMTPAEAYATPVALEGATWGMGICYDLEFPEFVRAQAAAGADIVLVPTAVPELEQGVEGLGEAWHYSATLTSTLQVPARALESGVVIAYANHCGPGFTGRSCIATPFGRHAALLGDEPGVAVVEIPLGAVRSARAVNTYLPDLRRASAVTPNRPEEHL